MKKQKKFISIILVFFLFPFTACEDYLAVTPPDELAPEDIISEKGITALLYSAYAGQFWGAEWKGVQNMTQTTTDIDYCIGGGEGLILSQFISFQWDASVPQIESIMWNTPYSAIRDANLVIENIESVEGMPEENKKQFIAEARYIRASIYYFLYDWFGPVPLRTSSTQDVHLPRSTEEEMQVFIETELSEVIADLPVPGQEPEYGRATKGHALGFLAKHYLNSKQWSKVLEVSQQLMDLGYYELFPEFTGLFRVENEGNKEMIVVWTKTNEGGGNANVFPNGAFPPGFEQAPSLPEFTWTTQMRNWAVQYKLRDAFLNTFDPDDKRLDLIVTEYINRQGKTVNLLNTPDNARSLKYFDNDAIANAHGNDWPIIRYADILLSRAEALNEINGPTMEALDLINEVRNRAGLEDLAPSDAGSKEQLRDLILEERGKEFVSEAKRRQDLIRHGKFISKALERGISAQPYHLKFPIPQSEINANNAINEENQNEGY